MKGVYDACQAFYEQEAMALAAYWHSLATLSNHVLGLIVPDWEEFVVKTWDATLIQERLLDNPRKGLLTPFHNLVRKATREFDAERYQGLKLLEKSEGFAGEWGKLDNAMSHAVKTSAVTAGAWMGNVNVYLYIYKNIY